MGPIFLGGESNKQQMYGNFGGISLMRPVWLVSYTCVVGEVFDELFACLLMSWCEFAHAM